ncbi:MAG: NCS2 family permease [Actinomyces sp.]|uniref:NCS2 family permease n=1 Tax=Schaalia naturae TaxID=635203 RepID=A0ABW2SJT1_9ACTO|nr:NCS2 family permease [Actinomyces sp.]MCI1787883.1 NCS2 family permease [Actinomyces sp.]MCI1830997.1 NCS2 family permease [Actinomyces sp.]MCI1867459.1 NCS2 family permease [Actinomyces sp.]
MRTTTERPRSSSTVPLNPVDKFFHITERGSTVGREVRGGFVTFFAMAYILVINPIILSSALPEDATFTTTDIAAGTALVAGVMTILMGVVANYPLALAAGMGLNAVVSFTLVLGSGLTYQEAMGLIFWEGVLITVLVLTGFREAVFKAVPRQLKTAISVGIGLFIAFVGLINAGIIRPGGTPVQLGINGSLDGWPALVFVVGLFLTIILYVRKVKGAILISILASTVLAVVIQAITHLGVQSDDLPTGWGQTVPEITGAPVALPSFGSLLQVDFFGAFSKLGPLAVILLIFSLMLADFFDTMGTMVAIGAEADLLDEHGNPPKSKQILLVDSLSAMAGGLGGVSSNTSFVESSAGVGEGARTGFASVITGVLFLLSTFLAPVVELVPTEAASTALVFVGFLMMTQVLDLDWKSPEIAIPAFLTIAFMPFAYSISVGIGVGFIAYTVIQIALGKARKVHPLMWLISVLFVLYFALGPIQNALVG